jgi:hypothetical protein
MLGRSRLSAAMLGFGVLLFALVAQAQRVVLLRPTDVDAVLVEAFNRLHAELRLQNFEVTIVDTNVEARSPEALEEAAKRADALATISFVRHGSKTKVDVWLADRVSGKTTMRTIEPPGGTDVASVLAIRAVDLLRTSLREFGGEPPPPDVVGVVSTPPPDSVRALVAPPRPTWQIRAEGIVLWDGPSFGAALGAGFALSRRLGERTDVGILLAGPLVGPTLRTSEGSASVRQELGWVEVRVLAWEARPIEVGASLAAGVHRLEAQGRPNPPLLAKNEDAWSFAGAVGAHGEVRLTTNAAIGLNVRAIALTPRPGVAVNTSVGMLQFPLLGGSVGLLVGF